MIVDISNGKYRIHPLENQPTTSLVITDEVFFMDNPKGFTKVYNNQLFSTHLSPISKLVLIGLSYFDRTGRGCWCKRETLSKYLNISLYQLRKSLLELETEELITITKRHNGLTDIIKVNQEPSVKTSPHRVKKTTTPYINIIEEDCIEEDLDVSTDTEKGLEETTETSIDGVEEEISEEETQPIYNTIKENINSKSYAVWFDELRIKKLTENDIVFSSKSNLVVDWLSKHYISRLETLLSKKVSITSIPKRRYEDGKKEYQRSS